MYKVQMGLLLCMYVGLARYVLFNTSMGKGVNVLSLRGIEEFEGYEV